jgi:hypothetical protein
MRLVESCACFCKLCPKQADLLNSLFTQARALHEGA